MLFCMATRTPLSAKPSRVLQAAASARNSPRHVPAPAGKFKTTGISLPPDVLELLIDLSVKRRKLRGGRASVSAILLELVQRHRDELEAELAG